MPLAVMIDTKLLIVIMGMAVGQQAHPHRLGSRTHTLHT